MVLCQENFGIFTILWLHLEVYQHQGIRATLFNQLKGDSSAGISCVADVI